MTAEQIVNQRQLNRQLQLTATDKVGEERDMKRTLIDAAADRQQHQHQQQQIS